MSNAQPTPSRFRRILDALRRPFAGRRVSNASIVNGTAGELRQKMGRGGDTAQSALSKLVTPFMTSYLATWTFPRVTSRMASQRARLRSGLARARDAFIGASVDGKLALADLDLPHLKKEYDKVLDQAHSFRTAMRSHHLPLVWYVLAAVVVGVVDWYFFYGIIMDANDASPSSPGYLAVVITSAAFALTSPITVILLSEFGGRRFARFRFEIREVLDAEPRVNQDRNEKVRALLSLFVAPALIIVGLVSVLVVFWNFALHRFDSLVGQAGAVGVDPFWLAVLITMLPVLTFVASVFHHDVPTTHRKKVTADWAHAQAVMVRNQNAVREAMFAWTEAWGALRDMVGRIVAEANLGGGTWEHLVLLGIARANQAGETDVELDDVVAKQGTATTPEPGAASEAEERIFTAPEIVRMQATSFTSSEWVIDEILVDIEALVTNVPTWAGVTAKDIERLLALVYPTAQALESAPAEEREPAETEAEPAQVDTAHLEAMLAREPR